MIEDNELFAELMSGSINGELTEFAEKHELSASNVRTYFVDFAFIILMSYNTFKSCADDFDSLRLNRITSQYLQLLGKRYDFDDVMQTKLGVFFRTKLVEILKVYQDKIKGDEDTEAEEAEEAEAEAKRLLDEKLKDTDFKGAEDFQEKLNEFFVSNEQKYQKTVFDVLGDRVTDKEAQKQFNERMFILLADLLKGMVLCRKANDTIKEALKQKEVFLELLHGWAGLHVGHEQEAHDFARTVFAEFLLRFMIKPIMANMD